MLHIDEADLSRRELAARAAFAASRGTSRLEVAPTAETVRKLKLLADELQLLSGEIGTQEFTQEWSDVTDAWIITRDTVKKLSERFDLPIYF